MAIELDRFLAERARHLKASEIRELLKLTERPGMISLAGGLPNPAAFPVEIVKECIDKVFEKDIDKALQYGTTEGLTPLRATLAERMCEKYGFECDQNNVLVTSGAQQALFLTGLVFLDPGDVYMSIPPVYLGAIQAFHTVEGRFEAIPRIGMEVDLDGARKKLDRMKGEGRYPKFIYTVPTFQNPSGETMPLSERKELLDIAKEYDLIIIEDDPYGEIRFDGDHVPCIKALDDEDRVIFMSTFSKILAPGFRLGWVVAQRDTLRKYILAKQSVDLCTNVFSQFVANEYIAGGYLDRHITSIQVLYKKKRDVMVKALEDFMPEGITWNSPEGGMFFWLRLPECVNTRELFDKAIEKNVAYVVGDAFYPDNDNFCSMRLNYSYATDENIREGIKRLAEAIAEEM